MVSAVVIVVDVVDQRCCDINQRRTCCDRPIIIGIVIVIVTQIICVPGRWNGEGRQAPQHEALALAPNVPVVCSNVLVIFVL